VGGRGERRKREVGGGEVRRRRRRRREEVGRQADKRAGMFRMRVLYSTFHPRCDK
jgi:hypothetical protein